jgi:hypothetical protein
MNGSSGHGSIATSSTGTGAGLGNIVSNRFRTYTSGSASAESSLRGAAPAGETPPAPAPAPTSTSTSTTKALLLSIAVPRIYRIYIPPKEQQQQQQQQQPEAAKQAKPEPEPADSAVHPLLKDAAPAPAPQSKAEASTVATETTATETQATSSSKPHRLLKGREEVPFTPDDHEPTTRQEVEGPSPSPEAPLSTSVKSAVSKVATLLVGESDEAEPEEKDDIRFVEIQSERNTSESIQEHQVGYVEGDEEEGSHASIVEHVITSEEMAMVVRIEPSEADLDKLLDTVPEDPTHARAQTDSSMLTAASDAIKSFFGVVNKNNENLSTKFLSREEAVAAIKHYDPARPLSHTAILELENEDAEDDEAKENLPVKPNTEIKLEELLRLTFRNLYMENHFYNAPIYTDVQTRMSQEAEMDEWVELSVM